MNTQHQMSKAARWITAVAALMMIGVYFFPLWKISLDAPQYPEGLEMHIWVHQITGDRPNTLENINLLNHYIGMQPIEPDAIPELRYMPYIVVLLMIIGLIVAWAGRRKWLMIWLLLFVIVAVIGLVDFYLWEYDYGHNLDPSAPLKLLDSYQPPLIGYKQLLNITAGSFPHIGGWILVASLVLGITAWLLDSRTS